MQLSFLSHGSYLLSFTCFMLVSVLLGLAHPAVLFNVRNRAYLVYRERMVTYVIFILK